MSRVAGSERKVGREYTCDGADRSPPLDWSGIPSNAVELTLFVLNFKPVGGELFFDWSVAGLSPELHGLRTGRLPVGAVVGRNGFGHTGYSICPSNGAHEKYVFVLYAPTKRVAARPDFDPLALRSQVLRSSRGAGLITGEYARG